jgi:hypothetical protein
MLSSEGRRLAPSHNAGSAPLIDGTSFVGDGQQHVSVAGPIERAVAGEVASSQFMLDVIDGHLEPTGE